jgi:hypothetical protein
MPISRLLTRAIEPGDRSLGHGRLPLPLHRVEERKPAPKNSLPKRLKEVQTARSQPGQLLASFETSTVQVAAQHYALLS